VTVEVLKRPICEHGNPILGILEVLNGVGVSVILNGRTPGGVRFEGPEEIIASVNVGLGRHRLCFRALLETYP
jgi:hypothetical protein